VELRRVDPVLPRPDLRGAARSGRGCGWTAGAEGGNSDAWRSDPTLLGLDLVLLRWQRHAAPSLETQADVGFGDDGGLL
jgi:hypothetical protein